MKRLLKKIARRLGLLEFRKIRNPKLIMTILAKNEADIIRQNIEFHHAMGVDGFIVTDNISDDGTREIFEEYRSRGWILEIIDEKSQDYSQIDWVHRMAALARDKYHADLIINADADEFWYSKSGNLKTELANANANKMYVPIFNMLDTNSDWSKCTVIIKTHLDEDVAAKLIDAGRLCKFHQFSRQIPKVMVRAADYVKIHMGNHNADMACRGDMTSNDIMIFHYPSRGHDHFVRKMITGGAAFERNMQLGRNVGAHWRYFYNGFRNGTLNMDDEYQKHIGATCRGKIADLLETNDTVKRILDGIAHKN